MQRSFGQPEADLATQTVIYVGLIPFEWTEENLKAVVCSLGTVLSIHFGTDHFGKNKGFAFVEYLSPQQAKNAINVLLQSLATNPMTGYTRRFKANLSKEPNKNAHLTNRSPILPNPSAMPHGMQFPPDFAPQAPMNAPGAPQDGYSSRPHEQFNQPMQQRQVPIQNVTAAPPPPPVVSSAKSAVPERYLKASESLPIPQKLPFTTPDKISETLALLPPVEVIQLIANLKVILESGDVTRAADVFKLSPQLANAATQVLLLMGFVDEAVIQETMKSGGALPQASAGSASTQIQPPLNPQMQNNQNQFSTASVGSHAPVQPNFQGLDQGGFNRGAYIQPQNHQNYNQQPGYSQNYRQQNNFSRGYNSVQNHNQKFPPQGPSGLPQQTQGTNQGRWPHLPMSTQIKLANLAPNEAQVIADVLSMPMDQIGQLSSDRQEIIMNLRQQYM